MNAIPKIGFGVLSLVTVLLAVFCLSPDKLSADKEQRVDVTYQVQEDPLTIAVSTVGRFAKGYSWHLSVNSSGKAELTIDTFPERTRREFQIPAERLEALRKLLLQEQFFELKDEYGQIVPDGSTDTITVIAGEEVKTVKLQFLMNWANHEKSKVREPARAVRVLLLIREWFDDPNAVDLRRYDRMVVEAAESVD